jgi:hypothetical protein
MKRYRRTLIGGALCLLLSAGAGTAMASPDLQALDQTVRSAQAATSAARSVQHQPTNENISIRIHSPGDDGSVTQTNAAAAVAGALNTNATTQSADQGQAGGGGIQAAGQHADNDQGAEAAAEAVQKKPTNDNLAVRIHSPGDDGDVAQTNAALAKGVAANGNATDQTASQRQGDEVDGTRKGRTPKGAGTRSEHTPKHAGGRPVGVQAIGQEADSAQHADADATARQYGAVNANRPVRVGSPGGGGSVAQANASLAAALGLNDSELTQRATQTQGGGATPKP